MQEAYALKKGTREVDPDSVPMSEIACPDCGTKGQWTEPRDFNMMLKTYLGPIETEEGLHYLRPETAQGIFVNFANVVTTARKKPPFGIGQIGKSFRNEITPGNFIFRTREFEQMEMEFFVEPDCAPEWHQYWIDTRLQWYVDLGIDRDNLRLYEHPKEKLSHYSDRTVDIEYKFGFQGNPWGELEGVANRTNFDLSTHSKHSGVDLSFYDQATETRYVPYVIEPAAGLTRSLMAFLVDAYHEDEAPNAKGGVDKRTVLRLDPRLAPVKAAVLPLSRNEELSPKARDLAAELRKSWNIEFDDAGAIGRRYRRQDEIGTPFCVTVDFDSLEDQAVTIRERDAMTQDRVALDAVSDYLADRASRASRPPSRSRASRAFNRPASTFRGCANPGRAPCNRLTSGQTRRWTCAHAAAGAATGPPGLRRRPRRRCSCVPTNATTRRTTSTGPCRARRRNHRRNRRAPPAAEDVADDDAADDPAHVGTLPPPPQPDVYVRCAA